MVTTNEGYGTGIRVLTLNVHATTDDFMSVDCKAFETAVWEASDGTKHQLFFSYMIACAMFPLASSLLWMSHIRPYHS